MTVFVTRVVNTTAFFGLIAVTMEEEEDEFDPVELGLPFVVIFFGAVTVAMIGGIMIGGMERILAMD